MFGFTDNRTPTGITKSRWNRFPNTCAGAEKPPALVFHILSSTAFCDGEANDRTIDAILVHRDTNVAGVLMDGQLRRRPFFVMVKWCLAAYSSTVGKTSRQVTKSVSSHFS